MLVVKIPSEIEIDYNYIVDPRCLYFTNFRWVSEFEIEVNTQLETPASRRAFPFAGDCAGGRNVVKYI